MLICVWNAVHLNIPSTRLTLTYQIFNRVLWMLIALIAPEVLLFLAVTQRIDASMLKKEAVEYLPSRRLAKPGWLARACNYILRRTKSEDVSL